MRRTPGRTQLRPVWRSLMLTCNPAVHPIHEEDALEIGSNVQNLERAVTFAAGPADRSCVLRRLLISRHRMGDILDGRRGGS